MTTLQINSIVVRDRYRRDLGDLQSLAASISDLGLLQPVVVTPDHVLVAGQRRLEAVKSLGWTEVDVRVVDSTLDAVAALRAERDENTERKPMTASEMVALGKRLEAIEEPEARARQAHGETAPGRPANASVPRNLSVDDGLAAETGRVRHEVGKALGISGPTYQRMKTVVDAAEDESQPREVRETAEKVLAKVDAGRIGVRPAAKAVVEAKEAAKHPPKNPAIDLTSTRDLQRASANARKFSDLCGELVGLARAAEDIHVGYAVASGDHEQLRESIKRAEQSFKRIRTAINAIKEEVK
jgi:ParB-like chromosome segregation protein Spo0J